MRLWPLIIVAASAGDVFAQASMTTGSIRGTVIDDATGLATPGATIVVQSPSLQDHQAVISDEQGLYFVTSLPPGMYTLTTFYAANNFTRGNVLVQIGKESLVNLHVDSNTGKENETIVIRGNAPLLDQGSTKIGITLTDIYTQNVPTGRTVGGVLESVAGSQKDFYGVSLAGSTSVENTYVIDGLNTTDTSRGQLIADLPNEFVQETEIITGGYNAEFGRATGGIVNVVTKSGGEDVHGSVFGNLTPGGLIAASKVIQREGGSVDTSTGTDYIVDVGGEVGGAIIPKKLWFHVGFDPSFSHRTLTRLVETQTDKDGNGIPDVDPNGLTHHELVDSTDIPAHLATYYFTAKLSGAINPDHQGSLSIFGNPTVGDDFVSQTNFVSARDANLFDTATGAIDGALKWTSKFRDGETQVDAVLGYHHGYLRDSAHGALAGEATAIYSYERSLFDFADLEGNIDACNDNSPSDKYKAIRNCPVSNYNDGGVGNLEHRTNDRYSATASVTQRVKAYGTHAIKAGIDADISTYDSHSSYSGGKFLTRFCNQVSSGDCTDIPVSAGGVSPGLWIVTDYYKVAGKGEMGQFPCGTVLCVETGNFDASTTDRNLAAYVQDSWAIRPNLVIDYGLRFEQQHANPATEVVNTTSPLGETVSGNGVTTNNWAPRLGVIWDPTHEGHAKVFGHVGRFYENVPLDLNTRGLGGEIDNVYLLNATQLQPGAPGFNPACATDHAPGQSAGKALAGCTDFLQALILGGGTDFVPKDIGGQYIDEAIAGAEYELMADISVGLTYTHRQIGDVLEDVQTPDGELFIVNPGHDYTSDASELDQQAANEKDPTIAALDSYRAAQLRRIKTFDAPSRDYDAVTFSVHQRPTQRSLINASYTYSKERGNYPGLFSTETNQLDPNQSTQYDLPALMANRYGPLGLDRTHVFKLEGFYQLDLPTGFAIFGASLHAQSGIPHNTLGRDPAYGPGEAYLLPRGTVERSPMTSQLDLLLQYGRKLPHGLTAIGYIDIFNVFDQQDELVTDENYTFDAAVPIVGGDANDLKHLKAVDPGTGAPTPNTVHVNPNFDHTVNNQLPRSVRFGFRVLF